MKFYYYKALPLYVILPPAITVEDERLKDPVHFKHKFDSWENIYKQDIFSSIKEKGQIDPNIACWENNRWRIEPGQARWLAMHYLGFKTQKVVLCVNESKDPDYSKFLSYEHIEMTSDEVRELFTDKRDHVGYDYIYRRWLR